VIQSTLFFILGFLCAGFLALMVAPALWRRAVSLTRKRIEASMPLTLNEMQAETDRVRAEAAMSIRRLEISVKSLKEKAANQLIELNRNREELRRLTGETSNTTGLLAGLGARVPELEAKLREREEQVEALSRRLREADDLIEKRAEELEKLSQTYEEMTFLSSSRQIEIAGRESEVEKLSMDVSRLRNQREDLERRLQEMTAEKEELGGALKAERKRVADLETKIEQMLSKLTDREEALERRDRELSRLRPKGEGEAGNENDPHAQPPGTMKTAAAARPTDAARQSPAVWEGDETADKLARLAADRDRLESRLTTLTRENKKLRARTANKGESGRPDDAVLREQIHQLAAEVVRLTAALDGPDSPISKALAMPSANGFDGGEQNEKITSLADRVRALQKAASAN
jgi:chromosome segregation ATPase